MSWMRASRREAVIAVVAVLVLALDQLSKAAVMRYLPPLTPWNPIQPLSRIVVLNYLTNTGAAFGLFPQLGNYYVFINLGIVAALFFFRGRFGIGHWLLQVSLGMQLGGALGNLSDRVRFGHVIDFIDFKVWPVFNVADSCIVVGVVILALLLLREKPEAQPEQIAQDAGGLPGTRLE